MVVRCFNHRNKGEITITEEENIQLLNLSRIINDFVLEHKDTGWYAPDLAKVIISELDTLVQLRESVEIAKLRGKVADLEIAVEQSDLMLKSIAGDVAREFKSKCHTQYTTVDSIVVKILWSDWNKYDIKEGRV